MELMRYQLLEIPYDRKAAVEYADYWAYRRNPKYYAFDDIGGDCTNFVSQCIFAGCGVMNFTPTYGWYYLDLNDRAPAWTGVEYLYRFLTENRGPGPFGREAPISELEPGDVLQFALGGSPEYRHTVLVTRASPNLSELLVAAHDNDANCRQADTYSYNALRGIHLEGARYINRE